MARNWKELICEPTRSTAGSVSTSANLIAEGNAFRNYTSNLNGARVEWVTKDEAGRMFLDGADTRPYQFWNTGMVGQQKVSDMFKDMTHYWNEDSLYAEGGDEMNTEALVNSLSTGVEKGWITDDEAKAEFRAAFGTVKAADYEEKTKATAISQLEARLAELKGSGEESG